MASTHRLLQRGPGYAGSPPAPAALEEAVGVLQERHRLRIEGLQRLRQIEVELSEALQAALRPVPVAAQPSWITRALISAGLVEPAPTAPPLQILWSRHETALEKVRALSHHVELLDRDIALLAEEIPQLSEQIRVLSVDRVKAEAHEVALMSARQRLNEAPGSAERASLGASLDAALRQVRKERGRLAAAVERYRSVKLLNQELEQVLIGVSEGLEQLYLDATAALGGLNRRITGLAAAAAAAELEEGGGLAALEHTLSELAVTATERAVRIEHSLDTLSEKLAALDAEAAARRAAREEVDAALGDRGA